MQELHNTPVDARTGVPTGGVVKGVWYGDACIHPSDSDNIGPEWERITYWLYRSSGKVQRKRDALVPGAASLPQEPVVHHKTKSQYTDEEIAVLEECLTLQEIVDYTDLPLGVVLSIFSEWNVKPVGHWPKQQARYSEEWARKLKAL
jgi:hypothetical protein